MPSTNRIFDVETGQMIEQPKRRRVFVKWEKGVSAETIAKQVIRELHGNKFGANDPLIPDEDAEDGMD